MNVKVFGLFRGKYVVNMAQIRGKYVAIMGYFMKKRRQQAKSKLAFEIA